MNLTTFLRPHFTRRLPTLETYDTDAERLQQEVLQMLLREGAKTEYGRKYGFDDLKTYENFAEYTPLNTYETLKESIDRMRHGEENVLWPGQVQWYAKSSGTTNDKSKFIPVSKQGLKDTHSKGTYDTLAFYLKNYYPDTNICFGKSLFLGGSHAPNYNLPHSYVGDLSAILIENLSAFANLVRTPSKSTALLSDFEEKRDRIAHEAVKQRVVSLSGVPSWMLSVLKRVLEVSGKESIDQVWPHLEVFFHGGISFTPYRQIYRDLIRSDKMRYMETYNASEGFFGIQNNPDDPSLLLMVDYGVFFEFIPMEDFGGDHPRVVPLQDVEVGKNYAMIISTTNGLWRYEIGDTVRFTSKNPYKFLITGRTKSFINAFGEELIVDNAEKGLHAACEATGAEVSDYTAAPVFMDKEGKCRHQWVIEFAKRPANIDEFADILDKNLQKINSDYEAKRFKDITLQPLEIVVARPGLFNDWLKSRGKLGGQHKVPRLCNNRDIIEQVLALNS